MPRLQACPRCRALLEPSVRRCPYCDADQRREAPAPAPGGADAVATTHLGLWLLAFNVAIFALMVLLDPAPNDRPLEPSIESALTYGASMTRLCRECGQYWRLLTAMFVHFDVLHLLFNSIAIFILIPLAAVTLGSHRTTAIYFATGVLGAFASVMLGPGVPSGGASGAICGLIGALGVWGWRRGGWEGRMLSRRMAMWALFVLVYGLILRDRIDNFAHGGGFVAGAALGWLAGAVRITGGLAERAWRAAATGSVGIAVLVGAVFLVPSVARGQERRPVIEFEATVRRLLDQLDQVAAGRAQSSDLPDTVDGGPRGTDGVRSAVVAALDAVRRAPAAPATREAIDAADTAWRRWLETLGCSHGLWWEPR